jgi:hypothetical protein
VPSRFFFSVNVFVVCGLHSGVRTVHEIGRITSLTSGKGFEQIIKTNGNREPKGSLKAHTPTAVTSRTVIAATSSFSARDRADKSRCTDGGCGTG